MKTTLRSLIVCSVVASQVATFGADVPIPRDTVASRVRAELQPLGTHVSAFTIHAGIDAKSIHDSNVYAQSTNPISDTINVLRPRIAASSNWSRHSLGFAANAAIGNYDSNTSENYTDTSVSANVRLDISRASSLRMSGSLESLHEDRFSPDDRDGLEPTTYDHNMFSIAYKRRSGNITLRLETRFVDADYDDVTGRDGDINNDDRDRHQAKLQFRVGYGLGPDTEIFVRGAVASTDYDFALDDNGFARSSSSSEIAVGASFDLTSITSFEGFVGHMQRDFDDATLNDIDTTWFGSKLTWRMSGLTTFTGEATRLIEETTLSTSGGYVATRFRAAIDHELLRNLVLHYSVYQQNNSYQGIERKDDINGTTLAAQFALNRNLNIDFEYHYRDRDIEGAAGSADGYDTSNFSVQLRSAL